MILMFLSAQMFISYLKLSVNFLALRKPAEFLTRRQEHFQATKRSITIIIGTIARNDHCPTLRDIMKLCKKVFLSQCENNIERTTTEAPDYVIISYNCQNYK